MEAHCYASSLVDKLNDNGIDGEVYVQYFSSMLLDESCSSQDIAGWIANLNADLSSETCNSLGMEIFDRIKSNDIYATISTLAPVTAAVEVFIDASNDPNTDCPEENSSLIPENEAFAAEELNSDVASSVDFTTDAFDFDHFVDIAESAFLVEQRLAEIYPSSMFSEDIILNLLEALNYDHEWVVLLLSRAFDSASTCRPCRHLLSSTCLLTNCIFDHDLCYIPCRYWLLSVGCNVYKGEIQGRNCPFLHGIPNEWVEEALAAKVGQLSIEPGIDQEVDSFPELRSLTLSKASNTKVPDSNSKKGKSIRKNVFRMGATSYANAPLNIDSRLQSLSAQGLNTKQEFDVDVKAGLSWFSHSFGDLADSVSRNGDVLWVDSGKSVGACYAALRNKARDAAIARNKLLDSATRAYLSGSKELARQLSAQGKVVNASMKLRHLEAAKIMFAKRNSFVLLENGQLDLHGLHLAEAELCLFEIVPVLRLIAKHIRTKQTMALKRNVDDSARALLVRLSFNCPLFESNRLRIVTGSGHHSVGIANAGSGAGRLLTRVKSIVKTLQCEFSDIKDANGYIGGIVVTL